MVWKTYVSGIPFFDFRLRSPRRAELPEIYLQIHLIAFKCLFLTDLPISRVLPLSYIPKDDDVTMQWVKKELSVTEAEVRSGEVGSGRGYSFYLQLAGILERPLTLPEPNLIPERNLRPTSYEKTYHFSSSSDSDYSTDPKTSVAKPTKRRASGSVTFLKPVPVGADEQVAEDQDMPDLDAESTTTIPNDGTDTKEAQPQSGIEWERRSGEFSISSSMKSMDMDKLEVLSNQMATTFLGLLAGMEHDSHKKQDRKVSFRYFVIVSRTDAVVLFL